MSMLDESEYESWETLMEIFRMPTLRFLEIMGWDDTARPIEDDFQDPGMSDVTHLMLTQCGALNTEMIPLLQWPKDLQRLRIKSGLPTYDDEDSDLGDRGDVSIQEAVVTIQPLKDTLLELDFDPGDSRNWTQPMEPLQSRAFSNFQAPATKRTTRDLCRLDGIHEISSHSCLSHQFPVISRETDPGYNVRRSPQLRARTS